MTYKIARVEKLTCHIGAEVSGIDLAQALDDEAFQDIQRALNENLVIFFRDQAITIEEQVNFGKRFGRLHVHPAAVSDATETAAPGNAEAKSPRNNFLFHAAGHPEVLVIHTDKDSTRSAGENWHTDVSCDVEPPLGSILRLTEVPPLGGDTLFSSMYAAYDALSDRLKRFLCELTAIHDGTQVFGRKFAPGKVYPQCEHPVIRTHPATGRKALFVNCEFTTRITQLGRTESDALLQFLFRHIETSEFQCRFRWRKDSIAFWDNRCAQHHAMWDYFPHTRHGYRVTVTGDRPFYQA